MLFLQNLKALDLSLIVQQLILFCEFQEKCVCSNKLPSQDSMLLEKSNASDKFTEVQPVRLRKNTVQQCWAEPKDIQKKLPSLVST